MTKKMRIIYLPGGAHLYGDNRSLLSTLSELKDKVDMLVCVTAEGPLTQALSNLGIPYRRIAGVMAPYVLFRYRNYSLKNRIIRQLQYIYTSIITRIQLGHIIREFQPDIIHSNNSNIYSGAKMAKRFGLPHVWHIREYMDLDHQAYFPNKHFFDTNRTWSHCIAITKGLFEHYHMERPKDIAIYNGIPLVEESLLSYHKEPYFLFLGRLVPSKGIEDLLYAFAQFKHNDKNHYKLKFAGEASPEYKKLLQQIVCKLTIENDVDFLGYKSDVFALLKTAKALVVPSYFEAMGRITVEAMLSQCLVIGRNTAGTKELLDNEKAGIPFLNTEELTQALQQVAAMSDDEIYAQTYSVRQSAEQHYSTSYNAQQILNFYNSVLHQAHAHH